MNERDPAPAVPAPRRPLARPRELLRLAPDEPPRVLALVFVEEEFDWSVPFDPANTSVRAVAAFRDAQGVFEEFGLRPVLAIDQPVAEDEAAVALLSELIVSGRALLGAHLHPWVTPPFAEEVCPYNSYPCNLPLDLERAKLASLVARLGERFGARPRIYAAGRYGLGAGSPALLAEAGFEVDMSVAPPYDFRGDGGPDFSRFGADPFWLDRPGGLLELPVTGDFVGLLRAGRGARHLLRLVHHPALRWSRLPGVLARLGGLERIRLSPEGFTSEELARLTRQLLARGTRVLTLSFHSPSLLPGCTSYVPDERARLLFLDRCRRWLELVLGELGGIASDPLSLRVELAAR